MRVLTIFISAGLLTFQLSAQTTAPKAAAPKATTPAVSGLATDDQKVIYVIGLNLSQSLKALDLSPAELEIVKRALSDSANNKPALDPAEYDSKVRAFALERGNRIAQRAKDESKEYIAKAAAEPGAIK